MVVEVMGRDAGWIALEAGIAGAASASTSPRGIHTASASRSRMVTQMSRTFAVGNMKAVDPHGEIVPQHGRLRLALGIRCQVSGVRRSKIERGTA